MGVQSVLNRFIYIVLSKVSTCLYPERSTEMANDMIKGWSAYYHCKWGFIFAEDSKSLGQSTIGHAYSAVYVTVCIMVSFYENKRFED